MSGLLAKEGVYLTYPETPLILYNFNDFNPITESAATSQQRTEINRYNPPKIYFAGNRLSTMKAIIRTIGNAIQQKCMHNEHMTTFQGNESSETANRKYQYIHTENRRPIYNRGVKLIIV